MDIRRARPADLPVVAGIYGREAREGHATFDLEPRPIELWEQRLDLPSQARLLAHPGERGLRRARRPGPRHRTGPVRRPAGVAGDDGVHLVVAAVALPNPATLALHRACGFEEVGTMREVGRELDRWIDVTWLQWILD